jgi:hypothetical protein
MASQFENLRTLEYRPFVETDNFDASSFAELAGVVGYPIPEDYLSFLREFPRSGMFMIEGGDAVIHGIEKLPGSHDGFYAVGMLYARCSNENYDLLAVARRPIYDGDVPRYTLLIGDDPFGNAFCLDLRPESFGKVYFWDHEHGSDVSGLYLLAHDFVSFVNGLQVNA